MALRFNTGIYEIVNTANGKRYVGSAVKLTARMNGHLSALRARRHGNGHLSAAWAKYGANAFEFRTLLICAKDDLLFYEQRAIDAYDPEYNIAKVAGSTLGVLLSEERKAKISAAHTGKKLAIPRSEEYRAAISARVTGRKLSAEVIAKISAAKKGRKLSEEHKRKIGAAGKVAWDEGRRTRRKSPEHRAKIAASLTGRKATPEHRANQAAAQRGSKRGPYRLDPNKTEQRCNTAAHARQYISSKSGIKLSDQRVAHMPDAARRGWIKRRQRQAHNNAQSIFDFGDEDPL